MKAETWFFFVQIFGENRDTDCCADRLHVADFSSDEPPMRSWCGAGWSHCSVTTRKNESATERIYTQARWVQQGEKKDHAHFSKYAASVTSHTCQQQNHMSMAKSWLVGTGCKIIMPESVMLLGRPDESVVSTQLGTVHEESLRKLLYG